MSAHEGEIVVIHFHDFGILRARVARELPTGFVVDLDLDDDGREKLASKIRWKRSNMHAHLVDKRDFPRLMPRHPRSVMTMGDGSRHPCFVIDISQSGAAVSASILPGKGTPLAIGALIGRVVRRLNVGFAMQFTVVHELSDLERMLVEPPGPVDALTEPAAAPGAQN
ncbi:PilZ domain-containing protein [Devosia sp.]|uniref:PilZ domain-containing protein n=1 Tax=Devosia sp. TaxID=1871048 RepID=UPI002FCA0193